MKIKCRSTKRGRSSTPCSVQKRRCSRSKYKRSSTPKVAKSRGRSQRPQSIGSEASSGSALSAAEDVQLRKRGSSMPHCTGADDATKRLPGAKAKGLARQPEHLSTAGNPGTEEFPFDQIHHLDINE